MTTLEALHPWSRAARLAATAGAVVLLLPLALLPWGSGGLLTRRARLRSPLELYASEGEEGEEAAQSWGQQEAGGGTPAGGAEAPGAAPDALGGGASSQEPLLGSLVESVQGGEPKAARGSEHAALPELSPWQCLATPGFWLLSAVCAIGTGTGKPLLQACLGRNCLGQNSQMGSVSGTRVVRASSSRPAWCAAPAAVRCQAMQLPWPQPW